MRFFPGVILSIFWECTNRGRGEVNRENLGLQSSETGIGPIHRFFRIVHCPVRDCTNGFRDCTNGFRDCTNGSAARLK